MSQLTHVTRTVFTDDARSTIPDSPGVNAAAQQWAEHRQRSLERLELDVKVARDGIERDWMAEPILKMMGPLLHFLCDMRELLEVQLGEQDGKVVNVHDVASQTLLETNTLKVGLHALDSKVGALESKVDALDLKVDNVRGVTSQALFGMNASEVGLRALDSKVDNVHGVVSQALFESNTLKVGLQALDSKVGALESKVDTLGSKVDKLESKVDANHEETMNALGRVLASIKELKG
ncbi:hypothetical protein HOY82DRAFT_671308 [Tuber indicum]|nr:hypothetical protein HOY82DRAFT_671308 [Tuber indicum]